MHGRHTQELIKDTYNRGNLFTRIDFELPKLPNKPFPYRGNTITEQIGNAYMQDFAFIIHHAKFLYME